MRSLRQAFTLVELLVAMSVAVIIVGSVAAVLYSGFAAWTRLASGCRPELEKAMMLSRLERDIASAVATAENPFRGDENFCEFIRLPAPGQRNGENPLIFIRWQWDPVTETVARMEINPESKRAIRESTLQFRPITAFKLRYISKNTHCDDSSLWLADWQADSVTNLPAALVAGDRGVDRKMVFRLHAAPRQ